LEKCELAQTQCLAFVAMISAAFYVEVVLLCMTLSIGLEYGKYFQNISLVNNCGDSWQTENPDNCNAP